VGALSIPRSLGYLEAISQIPSLRDTKVIAALTARCLGMDIKRASRGGAGHRGTSATGNEDPQQWQSLLGVLRLRLGWTGETQSLPMTGAGEGVQWGASFPSEGGVAGVPGTEQPPTLLFGSLLEVLGNGKLTETEARRRVAQHLDLLGMRAQEDVLRFAAEVAFLAHSRLQVGLRRRAQEDASPPSDYGAGTPEVGVAKSNVEQQARGGGGGGAGWSGALPEKSAEATVVMGNVCMVLDCLARMKVGKEVPDWVWDGISEVIRRAGGKGTPGQAARAVLAADRCGWAVGTMGLQSTEEVRTVRGTLARSQSRSRNGKSP